MESISNAVCPRQEDRRESNPNPHIRESQDLQCPECGHEGYMASGCFMCPYCGYSPCG